MNRDPFKDEAANQEQQEAPQSIGDAFLGKVPPHSQEAELSVIGGVLLHNEALDEVLDLITPGDFYTEAHEIVFAALVKLNEHGKPMDLIGLSEALKASGELEIVGGLAYLSGIMDAVPTAAHTRAHAEIIAEKAMVRATLGAALDILQKGYGEYGDAETYIADSIKAVDEATQMRHKNEVRSAKSAMMDTLSAIEKQREQKDELTGVDTGFHDLNDKTSGLQPEDLIIVAGRPSMGKTTFAMDVASYATTHGTGVLLFSLEMSIDQLMRRLLAREGSVEGHKLRNPCRLRGDDFTHMVEAADRVSGAPLWIDDSPEVNVLEIRSRVRRLCAKEKIGLIVIDYLGLIVELNAKESRERQVAQNTRRLKALARELGIPIMLLSQLNRGPENRADKRPELRDLRESGAIEQDADLIMFLYRKAAYQPNTADATIEVIIGKQRNGPIGTVKLKFEKDYPRIVNPDGTYTDAQEEPEVKDHGGMLGTKEDGDTPF